MYWSEQFLEEALHKRDKQDSRRKLVNNHHLIDFCSNDYLGFAQSDELKQQIAQIELHSLGSTGSRLLNGHTPLANQVEQEIAAFHRSETALIFNSGYDANLGLFSCIAQEGDAIIYDELIHASIHDGRRLSKAQTFAFSHNNIEHLEERLRQQSHNRTFVAVESVYSMDGDMAPLIEIAHLCEQYNAYLIVDEAHATGVVGQYGQGLVNELQLENKVFARIHTFGKALGCHGAAILGSSLLYDYLVNYARSIIYSTALPPHSLHTISAAYRLLSNSETTISHLHKLTSYFKQKSQQLRLIPSDTAIQCILVEGNLAAKQMAHSVQQAGFDVRAILSPTVPKGKERLRICLHAYNTFQEIDKLTHTIHHL